jgi:hypothetical protein
MLLRAGDRAYLSGAFMVFASLDEMTIDQMWAVRGVISA